MNRTSGMTRSNLRIQTAFWEEVVWPPLLPESWLIAHQPAQQSVSSWSFYVRSARYPCVCAALAPPAPSTRNSFHWIQFFHSLSTALRSACASTVPLSALSSVGPRRSDRRAIGFPNGDPHRATAGPRFRDDVRSGVPRSPETLPMPVEVLPRMPPLLTDLASFLGYLQKARCDTNLVICIHFK